MRFLSRLTRHWGGPASNLTVLALVTLVASGLRTPAQPHEISARDLRIAASQGATAESGRLVREIDDPSSGTRWLLLADKTNPGGPGRLEPAPQGINPAAAKRHTIASRAGQIRPATMIRPGERLIVEEHSATTDAYLEGVALGPAGPGTALNVRLSIGGRVVRAVAVASGRATLGTSTEAGR